MRPDLAASFLLITGACALWWVVSAIVGPIWLALRREECGPKDRDLDLWDDL